MSSRALDRMRARQARRADHGVRDHHRGGLPAVRAASGRRAAPRGRARRPARRHQRRRPPARQRHHAGVARSCRASGRDRRPRSPREKAGILKARRAGDRLGAAARGAGGDRAAGGAGEAPLSMAGEDWKAIEERGRLVYQDDGGLLDLPAPKLIGRHQFVNAGVAIATLRAVGLQACRCASSGIAQADWPARMQRLTPGRSRRSCRPAPSYGSTAGTIRTAAARRQRARRSRGARVATAGAHRRHAVDQGHCEAS